MTDGDGVIIRCRGLARDFALKGRRGAVTHAVKGVDIDVRAGEIVGFLGPNGAGKSTTLRMLTTLLRPTAGEATVAGCDLVRDPAGVRRHVGYVGQGNGISPDSTVNEELVLQGRLHRLDRHAARRRGRELADRLDLGGLEARLIRTLSGGQRRRVDLALALIHAPPLVFLDEPTTGLDPQSRANVWEHVRSMRSEHGTSVFLTTHYLDEADSLADRIIVIDHGRIVAEGSQRSLKSRVGGDSVMVEVTHQDVPETTRIIHRIPGSRDVTVDGAHIRFRIRSGGEIMPDLLHALGLAGIPTLGLHVRQPSLDDVFFALTGHSLRESDDPLAATGQAAAGRRAG
jgi:ABC-2 type transport system ATP-binding protein